MNIYEIRRAGGLTFLLLSIAMVVVFLLVSNSLVNDLATQERERMQIWADATKQIANVGNSTDGGTRADDNIEFLLSIIEQNHTIPVLLTDDEGHILFTAISTSPRKWTPQPRG